MRVLERTTHVRRVAAINYPIPHPSSGHFRPILNRRILQSIVKTKIALAVLAGIALLIGHNLVESDAEHKEKEDRYGKKLAPPLR